MSQIEKRANRNLLKKCITFVCGCIDNNKTHNNKKHEKIKNIKTCF